jgi:hypothetical protein
MSKLSSSSSSKSQFKKAKTGRKRTYINEVNINPFGSYEEFKRVWWNHHWGKFDWEEKFQELGDEAFSYYEKFVDLPNIYKELLNRFNSLPNPFKIYRSITYGFTPQQIENYIDALREGKVLKLHGEREGMGSSWSLNPAIRPILPEVARYDVSFEAEINKEEVDWFQTWIKNSDPYFGQGVWMEFEKEIFIPKTNKSPIKLRKVTVRDVKSFELITEVEEDFPSFRAD